MTHALKIMEVKLNELELIRARCRNGSTRDDEIIAHVFDVEIRRRTRAGAKPKETSLTTQERQNLSAKEYRSRKKQKKADASDRKHDREMARHRIRYGL